MSGPDKDAEPDLVASARRPTVVGIGASAGGLAALKTFFADIPEDSGLAFVVVIHLSPDHESHLTELLQPHARIPVQQVTETVLLEPDRVFVIPPNANLEAIDTHLRLSRLEAQRRARAPIDHFFRTLARTHDGSAIGVILTGTGSDGALGIKDIKEKHGVTVVQEPGDAEYDGMPRAAIATGLVDLVLPLAEIPQAVLRLARMEPIVSGVVEGGGSPPPDTRLVLHKIFAQVRARSGRDFSSYKRSTILRRIARRMQLGQVEDITAYLEVLQGDDNEVGLLADDLLINVTSFFRDVEVFQKLEQSVLPALLRSDDESRDFRVWSAGCATGEEAYSLAMAVLEAAEELDVSRRVQVFASDLHAHSLALAREGFYAGEIEADVSSARLQRFFRKEPGGYRVRRELRDLVVFAPHDLLTDPPFSRIDLLSCRNVMIYLERETQRNVVSLLHYALNPGGMLLLGTSETVDGSDQFSPEDKQLGLYRRQSVSARESRPPVFPPAPARLRDPDELAAALELGPTLAFGALHERMVERYAPPSLLVSRDNHVVHVSEHAGRYLVVPGGEPTTNVLNLVREELRAELLTLLYAVRERRVPLRSSPVSVLLDGGQSHVVLDVRPALQPADAGFVLVIFDERTSSDEQADVAEDPDSGSSPVREVEAELARTRQRLQTLIEEFDRGQEAMRAANEELQSTNEELHSTMEELETGKEELQSTNEELQTVNQENRHKVEELAQLSSDLQNLLTATDIATIFLDKELRILRFTPRVGELFNIRVIDRGRPLSDLTNRLTKNTLLEDAQAVLERLVPVEREVEDEAGRWHLARILPYRTATDQIVGVVLTLIEITDRKRGELALAESQARGAAELAGMLKLHELVSRLLHAQNLAAALDEVLDAAMDITRASMGNVLLHDEQQATLELVAQRGLLPEFSAPFRKVNQDDASSYWRAVRESRQVAVADIADDAAYAPHLQAAYSAGYRGVQSTPLIGRDGQVFGVLSTHTREPRTPSDRDLRMLELYARQAADYIEYVRGSERLGEKTEALEEEDRRKDRFLAMLGHEIRNPLAALDSAMRVIERGLQEPPEVLPRMAAHIRQLKTLVNDLLDIARISSGRITLRRTECDMTNVAHRAIEAVWSSIQGKRQDLDLDLSSELVAHVDATRIEQVMANLLRNASAFTPEGGWIRATLEQRGGDAVFVVSDGGRGIQSTELESIFEPFTQVGTPGGGLGIGLSLVKNLVELHGGSIQAESEGAGTGATFSIRIPLGELAGVQARRALLDGEGAPATCEPTRLPDGARILIIDDVRDSADMLALLLRESGAEVACAYTAADGLAKASEWSPDVVLVDIGLPDMTGYEVAGRLRADDTRHTLLLAVTGFGDAVAETKASAAGFDGKLLKPVDLDALLGILRQHLAQTRG